MSNKEQIKFIKELISTVQNHILSKACKFPENWDGIELRAFLADKFSECQFQGTLVGKRKKNYINDCLINNL